MGFRCGIVGLPNVGKSTLFNALTKTASAQAANFPFCTIEPNIGDVAVPDARLDQLAQIAKSAQSMPVWYAALLRAKGLAISFSPIFAKSTPLPMSCGVLRMATSPMSKGLLIR